MNPIKLLSIVILLFSVLLASLPGFAISRAVAKEYCIQSAEDEQIPKEERYEFIRDCTYNLSDEDIETSTEKSRLEPELEMNTE